MVQIHRERYHLTCYPKPFSRITLRDYEVIGDAPVPAQWVADRQSKIVQVQDSKELKPCECKTVPILSAVSKGLLKTHKVQSTGRQIHKQVRKFQ